MNIGILSLNSYVTFVVSFLMYLLIFLNFEIISSTYNRFIRVRTSNTGYAYAGFCVCLLPSYARSFYYLFFFCQLLKDTSQVDVRIFISKNRFLYDELTPVLTHNEILTGFCGTARSSPMVALLFTTKRLALTLAF